RSLRSRLPLTRGRLHIVPLREGDSRRRRQGVAHTPYRIGVRQQLLQFRVPVLQFRQLTQFLEQCVCAFGFLRIDPAEGKADMHKNVIAGRRVGRVFQTYLFDHAGEADLAHLHAVGLQRLNYFAWDCKTHDFSSSMTCRAAITCPSAIPPSLGGTRWCQYARKPAALSAATVRSVSRRFWKQPPVSSTRRSPTRRAISTTMFASVLWNFAAIMPIGR